jgi:large subunit ribosomal protein L17
MVFSLLQDKYAVTELFREVAQKVANRPGGYTRILKTGNRFGDAAEMCFIELVDYNENYNKTASAKKAKTTRRGRSKSTVVEPAAPVEAAAEETNQE